LQIAYCPLSIANLVTEFFSLIKNDVLCFSLAIQFATKTTLKMPSRRKFLVQGTLATTAMLVAKPFQSIAGTTSTNSNTLTLLHTNDICNKLSPMGAGSMYNGLGGFRQTAAMIRTERNTARNVLLLDAGNTYSGNTDHDSKHSETLQLMQEAGYDAVLPGKQDMNTDSSYLQQHQSKMKPYRIVWKGNMKIGVISANEDADAVNEIATKLKQRQHCDLVVCLSQLGYTNKNKMDDRKLAAASTHIDVIIGSNSRTFMKRPAIVLNKNRSEVIINHAGHSGIVLGKINIQFDSERNKRGVEFVNTMVGLKDKRWEDFS
jgi:5'-nucleotidase